MIPDNTTGLQVLLMILPDQSLKVLQGNGIVQNIVSLLQTPLSGYLGVHDLPNLEEMVRQYHTQYLEASRHARNH